MTPHKERIHFSDKSPEQLKEWAVTNFSAYLLYLGVLNQPEVYVKNRRLVGSLTRRAFQPAELRSGILSAIAHTVEAAETLSLQTGTSLEEVLTDFTEASYAYSQDILEEAPDIARIRPNPLADAPFVDHMHRLVQEHPIRYDEMADREIMRTLLPEELPIDHRFDTLVNSWMN